MGLLQNMFVSGGPVWCRMCPRDLLFQGQRWGTGDSPVKTLRGCILLVDVGSARPLLSLEVFRGLWVYFKLGLCFLDNLFLLPGFGLLHHPYGLR